MYPLVLKGLQKRTRCNEKLGCMNHWDILTVYQDLNEDMDQTSIFSL